MVFFYTIWLQMKRRIRLTESELTRVIKNSVYSILNEYIGDAGEYGIYPNDEDPTFNPIDRQSQSKNDFDIHDFGCAGESSYDPTNYSTDAIADNQIVNA